MFKIERFKALENQAQQLLDHESIIFDEGGAPKAHQANKMRTMSRAQFKDADLNLLDKYLTEEDIDSLRDFFNTFRFQHLFMLRG